MANSAAASASAVSAGVVSVTAPSARSAGTSPAAMSAGLLDTTGRVDLPNRRLNASLILLVREGFDMGLGGS